MRLRARHGNGTDSPERKADSGRVVRHSDRCEGQFRDRLRPARTDLGKGLWLTQTFCRNDKAGNQFSRPALRAPGPRDERGNRHLAAPIMMDEPHARLKRNQRRKTISCRGGGGNVTANGRGIPDLRAANPMRDIPEDGHKTRDDRIMQDILPAHQGTDDEITILPKNLMQFRRIQPLKRKQPVGAKIMARPHHKVSSPRNRDQFRVLGQTGQPVLQGQVRLGGNGAPVLRQAGCLLQRRADFHIARAPAKIALKGIIGGVIRVPPGPGHDNARRAETALHAARACQGGTDF